MTEKIYCNPFAPAGKLVEDIDDDRAAGQQFENGVERTTLGKGAEPRPPESACNELVQQLRLEWSSHKVKQTAVLRELADPRNGGHFPIAEVSRQKEQSFAPLVSADGRLHVLNPNPSLSTFR